jgi:hypothetical protein
MARAVQYILILSVMLIMFRMSGLGGGSPLLSVLLNIGNIKSLPIWTTIFGVFSLFAGVSGIVLGLAYPYKFDQWATAGMAVLFMNYVIEMIGIYNVISINVNYWIATVVVAPMIIFGIFIICDWWRGKDW